MFLGNRNKEGLSERQINYCVEAWQVLCGERQVTLSIEEATKYGSRTRFVEDKRALILGADAYPGVGPGANSRLSVLACLAHELSHFERLERGYSRPYEMPDALIDEAETSLNASFNLVLSRKEREDLVEDAKDRLIEWLSYKSNEEDSNEAD